MTRSASRLTARYGRLHAQLSDLMRKSADPVARMATIVALLHHKQPHFFWTGFYRLLEGKLVVGPYQGPLACAVLPGPDGVCWTAVRQAGPLLVPDVEQFPGHVACDSRSRSEVVVPVLDAHGKIVAVLDVDSDRGDAFSQIDVDGLVAIAALVYTSSSQENHSG